MYTLILTIISFGWFTDDTNTVVVKGFKSNASCVVAGEAAKLEHYKPLVSKAKYICVKE